MPTIGAAMVASVAAWLLDDLIASFASIPVRVLVNLVVSIWVFYQARRYLEELRGR